MFGLPEWKYFKYNLKQRFDELFASKSYSSRTYSGDSFSQKLAGICGSVTGNPAIMISLVTVCVLIAITVAAMSLFSGGGEKIKKHPNAWFYDLNTGELFVAKKTGIPPIEAPSGALKNGEPAGVIANLLVYDTALDAKGEFIGYLEKFTEEARDKREQAIKNNDLASLKWGEGRLIRRVEDKEWVEAGSRKGREILKAASQPNEHGQVPRYSYPE